jgi:hypothetical protein
LKPLFCCFKISLSGNGFRASSATVEMPFVPVGVSSGCVGDAIAPATKAALPIRIDSLDAIPLKKSFLLLIVCSEELLLPTVAKVYEQKTPCGKNIFDPLPERVGFPTW